MKELELNIDANDKEWLYNQYINLQRGLKDIADECHTTQDSIRNRLKRFDIPIRSHSDALKIRNKKYPNLLSEDIRKVSNEKKKTGKFIECSFCKKLFYINRKSKRMFCSRECGNNFRKENRNKSSDWRDWPEYRMWRNLVYSRDFWKCKICGSKHKINAHHILFANDFPERRFDTSNGITLCDEHHKKVHSPNSKELLLKNPNIGGSPEVDNPEASIREYLFSLIRSND